MSTIEKIITEILDFFRRVLMTVYLTVFDHNALIVQLRLENTPLIVKPLIYVLISLFCYLSYWISILDSSTISAAEFVKVYSSNLLQFSFLEKILLAFPLALILNGGIVLVAIFLKFPSRERRMFILASLFFFATITLAWVFRSLLVRAILLYIIKDRVSWYSYINPLVKTPTYWIVIILAIALPLHFAWRLYRSDRTSRRFFIMPLVTFGSFGLSTILIPFESSFLLKKENPPLRPIVAGDIDREDMRVVQIYYTKTKYIVKDELLRDMLHVDTTYKLSFITKIHVYNPEQFSYFIEPKHKFAFRFFLDSTRSSTGGLAMFATDIKAVTELRPKSFSEFVLKSDTIFEHAPGFKRQILGSTGFEGDVWSNYLKEENFRTLLKDNETFIPSGYIYQCSIGIIWDEKLWRKYFYNR